MSIIQSRGPQLNIDLCVEKVENRFDLVIIAAARAKEIRRQNNIARDGKHVNAPVSALLEIQEGKIGREYLRRIR